MQNHIWQKAISYTRAFQWTHMSRREAGILYQSCFLPALTYSLPAMGLPPHFLERVHKLSTATILNKMGFHSNLPRSVVFAPRHLGGVGLCNLIHEQSTQETIILLRHLRAQTPLGKAMEALIRTYQLWAGLRKHILADMQPCPWIPSQWMSGLRQSMHTNCVQLIYDAWNIQPLRAHDRFIMDDLIDQDFPKLKLEQLNACRMYLQVTMLTEITDHLGIELLPHVFLTTHQLAPIRLAGISSSKLKWPTVHCPSTTCWRLWTVTLQIIYMGSTKGTRLTSPLGPWSDHYNTTRFWHWQLHDPNHLVYCASPTTEICMALPTLQQQTMMKFSPTVLTTMAFIGPQ